MPSVTPILFYVFAAVAAGGAVGVAASRDIVRAAVCLLFALAGVAGVYFLLDAEFLAAVQLVVYVGGILVLIVFGVMLTSASPLVRYEPSRAEVVLAVALSTVLLASLAGVAVRGVFPLADPPATPGGVGSLGQALLGDYLVPFELASVLLLVVVMGAAHLAAGRRRSSPK
jgi:NADH:ubiquinone oxidoreductase subunit 6 (subunit J)